MTCRTKRDISQQCPRIMPISRLFVTVRKRRGRTSCDKFPVIILTTPRIQLFFITCWREIVLGVRSVPKKRADPHRFDIIVVFGNGGICDSIASRISVRGERSRYANPYLNEKWILPLFTTTFLYITSRLAIDDEAIRWISGIIVA